MRECRIPIGLSLLETTIAIGVIVTGLFAAFTLVISNRRLSDEVGLRFGAVSAARGGVEVVRSIRDSNWLDGTRPWDDGIAGSSGAYTGIARFNPDGAVWELSHDAAVFTDERTRVVRQQSVTGETYWTQSASSDATINPTPYRRLIDVYPICAGGQIVESGAPCDAVTNPKVGMRVRARVQWTSRGNTHEVTAEESMYDWR